MRKMIIATFIAVSIALAAGLLVIPAMEKVQASDTTSDAKNHGLQGTLKSDRTDPRSHTGLGCSPWDPRC
jgi:hypothetical protein